MVQHLHTMDTEWPTRKFPDISAVETRLEFTSKQQKASLLIRKFRILPPFPRLRSQTAVQSGQCHCPIFITRSMHKPVAMCFLVTDIQALMLLSFRPCKIISTPSSTKQRGTASAPPKKRAAQSPSMGHRKVEGLIITLNHQTMLLVGYFHQCSQKLASQMQSQVRKKVRGTCCWSNQRWPQESDKLTLKQSCGAFLSSRQGILEGDAWY